MRALYELPAPAKLNLFLHVIGRRADGYHLLQSVFVLIDWCDTLHIERRDDARLQRHDLTTALPADDLCLRAARALQDATGCSFGADISIEKRLPSGAGMGGGSSDAATTLLALNRLWGLDLPRSALQTIALKLGADVPFFIGGKNAWVEGIGEQLTPIDLPQRWYAVVKPAAEVSTAAIFGSKLLARDTDAATLAGFLASDSAHEIAAGADDPGTDAHAAFGRNDLQKAAEAACEEIVEVGQWLSARFGNSRMTGSGSAVFASAGSVFDDAAACCGTQRPPRVDLPQVLPAGWVGRMCRSLARHPLAGWSQGSTS